MPPNAPRIETPEELEAWIIARKKNWPSKANVERKVPKKPLLLCMRDPISQHEYIYRNKRMQKRKQEENYPAKNVTPIKEESNKMRRDKNWMSRKTPWLHNMILVQTRIVI